ncbi:MAG TPA: IclR family transcriptional regulator [Bauldia sp.]|nr:IclR family transcriptional regulator [Bauldia sp.]
MSVQLHRAIDILELIEAAERPLALGAIAAKVGMTKPAAHRLLQVLVERGYVEQDAETQAYRATLRLAIVGFGHLAATGMREVTFPELHRLAAETGELVRLAVVDGDTLTWIVEAQGARSGLRYDGNLGRQAVLHATAAGKAWLSTMSDEAAVALVMRKGFPGSEETGPRAVTTIDGLLATLKETRARGYSTAIEEAAVGVNAVSVPVFDPQAPGPCVATVIVVGPSARLTAERAAALVPLLKGAADRIGRLWPIRRHAVAPVVAAHG